AHSGGLPGYGSNMRWVPHSRVGVVALGNATYAPMSIMTRRILELLDEHGLVPVATIRASTALLDAAQRLAALLSDWTDSAANDLFADNVSLDESWERRAKQAAEL